MDIRFMCTNRGRDEYVLIDGKRYNCLKKAKDQIRSRATNGRVYAEEMEYLAWQVFVKGSIENDGFFAE